MTDSIISGYSEAAEVAAPCRGCREKPADPFAATIAQVALTAYQKGLEAGRAELPDVAAHSHGKGQEDALARVARWLELRAHLHGEKDVAKYGAAIRQGLWLRDLERLEGNLG